MIPRPWNLVADIGGTNARFGVQEYSSLLLTEVCSYSVADCQDFSEALARFLAHVANTGLWQTHPHVACLAVASVAEGDVIQFTNSPWEIDRNLVSVTLGGASVDLINDFAAVGYGITDLTSSDWHQVGGAEPTVSRPVAVLGPGTGLGVCSLVPVGNGWKVIEGEGGHVDFAPVTEEEVGVLRVLTSRFGRVSVERLLSGEGLLNIYLALAQLSGQRANLKKAADIADAALRGVETLAVRTLAMFCSILGSVAGNLALTLGAKGGVYIAGGICPRIIGFLKASDFRLRFDAKGRFQSYLESVPVRVVIKENLGLYGAIKKMNLLES